MLWFRLEDKSDAPSIHQAREFRRRAGKGRSAWHLHPSHQALRLPDRSPKFDRTGWEEIMIKEFKEFIARGNVVDLAVGIIIGAAFTAIVNSLVNDILMPPLGFLLGGIDFSNFFITLKGESHGTLKATQEAGAVVIAYGQFLNAIIKFLIV